MSAQANITVYDGASTPVAHTLVAAGSSVFNGENVVVWREALSTLPIEAQVRATSRSKILSSGVNRVSIRAEVPVMESVSGSNAAGYTAAPKIAYIDTMEAIGFFSPRSAPANRRLVRQLLVNLLGNVTTSVAAATSGPASELIDSNISAS